MLYEFKREDAFRFAKFVGIPHYEHGSELVFKECCYCHGRGSGNEKTFSINLETGAFNCFRASCGIKGNMITLAKDFDFELTRDFEEYYRPKKRYRTLKTPDKPIEPKDPAVKYMLSRGISEAITKKYEITTQIDHDNIIVFPFYDEKGELVFVKYRKADFDKEKDNNKEWSEANCKPILFGMKQCNLDNKRLIVTEGQCDSLAVSECGIENAVSVPTGAQGFTWIPYCWDWILNFEKIIVFGDYEKGRISLLDTLSRRLPVTVLHVRESDYGDCKDANEILLKYGKERVIECVENAVAIPIRHVISLADVEDVNPFDIEKMPTGFKDLDRLLYGGLPFGNLVVMTGKAGMGKSTVASQIIANAIDEGHKCFCYSGELPNHLFKSWLVYQIAGKSHVYSYQTKWGDTGYQVSETNRKLIDEWLRESIDIYDNSAVTDDEKVSIVKIIEESINRNGSDVILIDNLMTALDLDQSGGDDKYERQSRFVKKLARIAQQYDVLIILVAHMRKNNYSTNGNDEISGTSDITNLAAITLMYDSDKEDDDKRYLKVWKNRLFGKVKKSGWVMSYSEESKRVYGEHDNPNVKFGWERTEEEDDFPF